MNYVFSNLKLLFFSVALLVLAACSTQEPQLSEAEIQFVASVDIDSTITEAYLVREYGGKVIIFDAEAGFALIGFDKQPENLNVLAFEKNRAMFGVPESQAVGLGNQKDDNQSKQLNFSTQGASTWSNGASTWSNGASTWSNGASTWSNGASTWSNSESNKNAIGGYTPWNGSHAIWEGAPQTYTAQDNARQWEQIGLSVAHNQLSKSLGGDVIVAVIDTGIDINHPAFTNRLVQGYDFIDNDSHPQERAGTNYGHGTAVASVVLQIAPNASIMPIRALDGDGLGDTDVIARAIYFAIKSGADVINLSLGSYETSKPVLRVLKYAQSRGILVVASSGNTGDKQVTFPAREAILNSTLNKSLVSVGSVNYLDEKSLFSTYAKEELETVAPGEFILTAYPNNQVNYWSGTSFAAPMVSGAIALALGEQLLISQDELSEKAADFVSSDLYTVPVNAAKYFDQLGKGRLDIPKFLANVTR